MTKIQYMLTLRHEECGREIEKYAQQKYTELDLGECQGCGEDFATFRVVDHERVEMDQIPGLGVS